jgi:hypothetical protein
MHGAKVAYGRRFSEWDCLNLDFEDLEDWDIEYCAIRKMRQFNNLYLDIWI